jgi:hypothetical protein
LAAQFGSAGLADCVGLTFAFALIGSAQNARNSQRLKLKVSGFGFGVSGSGLEFKVWGLGFGGWWLGVWGLGFGV